MQRQGVQRRLIPQGQGVQLSPREEEEEGAAAGTTALDTDNCIPFRMNPSPLGLGFPFCIKGRLATVPPPSRGEEGPFQAQEGRSAQVDSCTPRRGGGPGVGCVIPSVKTFPGAVSGEERPLRTTSSLESRIPQSCV